ncbi:hypothetical protein [Thermoflavimicrobium daqui]|uniref:Uncharacterized protein n=1 Tax=Thermoflavimicrobium daqui TaxID=2137476 RepID=A0A364K4Y8_9BACL|nr:hypothetical protein [Thermoflavimicrobium daqui]RAL24423.1 hypothetical protein DL897_08850 [Thermoflavimicrobium daqui]
MANILVPIVTWVGLVVFFFLGFHFFDKGKKENSKASTVLGVIFAIAFIITLVYKIYWSFIR